MAKSTLNSHIYSAIKLQEHANSAYVVIGKTTPWANEENPPNEDENVASISEVIGYKKVSKFSLARPLRAEEDPATVGFPVVTYRGQGWVLVPADKAYEQGARWLYAEADIAPEDFPLGEYRQAGLHINLTPNSGVNKMNLLPSEVADPGILYGYENRERNNRTASVYALEQFVIQL